jgi:methylenetetrahydrofolate dehydrogenase (NADP+)/methenyltetrahydrofolate cyclohydrolase
MSKALLGKPIVALMAHELREKVARFPRKPSVGIIYAGNNPVIEHFISMKERFAESIGVRLSVSRISSSATTSEIIDAVRASASEHDGVIVQLPLPAGIDTTAVLDAVPLNKDIDMLSSAARDYIARGNSAALPAVAGAIREFIERTPIALAGKKIAIIGTGKLVGTPVHAWLKTLHIQSTIINRETKNLKHELETADVIISGAGTSGLITAEMVKDGAVLFDAGTSEVEGKIEGDISRDAYAKASYYTPVPGGIGPLTIACLFKNLVTLMDLN